MRGALCLTFCRIPWNRRMRIFWASLWRQPAADSRPPPSLSVLLFPDLWGMRWLSASEVWEPLRQNQYLETKDIYMERNVRNNGKRDPFTCMLGNNIGQLGVRDQLQYWTHPRRRWVDVVAVLAIHILIHGAVVLSLVSQEVLCSERSKWSLCIYLLFSFVPLRHFQDFDWKHRNRKMERKFPWT